MPWGTVTWRTTPTAGNGLRYANQSTSGWHSETVDADLVGLSLYALALDAAGKPHISYYHNDSLPHGEARYR